ncbi:MAG TPA: sulfite exporter TauE/SafE family protein [Jatrophihabitantaceae bacterium]|nr:sulfite exporter TauE/SafE family protein [Jatrophihabitantaceae bacterium]
MTAAQAVLVFVAGIAAGTINTVVGSGTLITFPVLLSIGLPPVTANVSNTLGLAPGSLVGAYGYRRELVGQRARVLALATAAISGGVLGAFLLLVLPSRAFSDVVPILIVLALLLVVLGPALNRRLARTGRAARAETTPLLWAVTFATAVYGGYFGAAQGVLLMGLFGLLLAETLQRQNALKNVLAGLVNLVAAVVFMITAQLDWAAAGLVAAGAILGGMLGARIGRRLPPLALRALIVVIGIVAILKLVL